jgi:hypothetical protein
MHVTVLVPTGNVEPLVGRQLVLSGGSPSITVGAVKETTCPAPSRDSTGLGDAGHVI